MLVALLSSAAVNGVCTAGLPNANVIESTPSSEFTVHDDGTVTHNATGLMWKRCAEGLSGAACETGMSTVLSWQNALQTANTANAAAFAGYTDWRLPNQKELESIIEYCGRLPAINQDVFPATPSLTFWSSTTIVKFPAAAWEVEFSDGSTNSTHKSGNFRARLVRGGDASALPGAAVAPAMGNWTLALLMVLLGTLGVAGLRRAITATAVSR
ncbi:MAG TPA: DUF1566 domain-containing protein [Rhizomicrobium sp.]